MFTQAQKKEVIKYGKKLVDYNLTSGTGGNISLYDPKDKEILITPSGFDFYEMTEEDLVIIDLEGNVLEAKSGQKPSSEWMMHGVFYKNREDLQAIIHAHTVYGTVLSCLREPLKPTHYMVAVAGEDIRVAEYATFGTEQLSRNAYEAMRDRKAVILANHGILGGEINLDKAFNVIEEVEYCSKIYCIAKSVGDPVILDRDEMEVMKHKFQNYGKNVKKH
ncbi:MAG: L-fuculose-phosphate aldolase [Firmicutes bacterium]|uniref:L-fuculose-phosphate aldolase n=1 Tax=Candidatus Scybalomonas excrementavium TaxID=2840943 RepID=A0A9D9N7S9_9FIRM|nr:L-fuculose-phosphate aldolase [Candidatus Scybalomonas excrementavium]